MTGLRSSRHTMIDLHSPARGYAVADHLCTSLVDEALAACGVP